MLHISLLVTNRHNKNVAAIFSVVYTLLSKDLTIRNKHYKLIASQRLMQIGVGYRNRYTTTCEAVHCAICLVYNSK